MTERTVFLAALDLPNPAARAAFLDEACGGDPALRRGVEELLAAHAAPGSLLDRPAPGVEPPAPTVGLPAETGPAGYGPADPAGTVIAGRYKLLAPIGEGGMGVVWVADQTEPVKRRVAVKLVKAGMDSRQVLLRFEAERQALALMDHPHIARVLDGGVTPDGRPFFAMELVEGVPVTDYCDKCNLPVPDRLRLFADICRAVQHAHQKGVIHRDLKPGNVLVAEHDGRPVPKVIDFGLAKALAGPGVLTDRTLFTGYGAVVGTPLYMAPEQVGVIAADVDTRADVYALGVILYELLTGTTPLEQGRVRAAVWDEVRRLIRDEEPPRPSSRLSSSAALPSIAARRHAEPAQLGRLVRGDLDRIALKALAKDRGRRYATADGLARDVGRFLAGEPVEAAPPSAGYRLRKFVGRNRGPVAAAGLVAAALVLGVVGTAWQAIRAEAARADAAGRAEAERRAKDEAVAAAAAEAAATRKAEARLAQVERGVDLLGGIFAGLDPKAEEKEGRPLRAVLADRLAAAADRLDAAAVDDPPTLVRLRNQLGVSLVAVGLPARAVPLHEANRADAAAAFGPDARDTLNCLSNLARAYNDVGRTAEAVTLYEDVARRLATAYGPDDPDVLAGRAGLAMAYCRAGRDAEAVPVLEDVARRRAAAGGPDDPATLSSEHSLAAALTKTGRPGRAAGLLDRVWRARAARDPDALDTLTCQTDLAEAYQWAGRPGDAAAVAADGLRRLRAKLDPDHPHTLRCQNNLAQALRAAGRPGEALPVCEDCLPRVRRTHGRDSQEALIVQGNLAGLYLALGRPADGLPLSEDCLRRMRAALGPDDPATLTAQRNLARAYARAGRPADAAPVFADLMPRLRVRLGAGSPGLAEMLGGAGADLLSAGRPADAEPYLRECLAIREAVEPDDRATPATRALLGGALLGQGKLGEAERLLVTGYEGMKHRDRTTPPGGRGLLREAAGRLVELYEKSGRPAEAARWRAERAKYPFVAPPPRPRE